mgnify:CR=1 FL=1
MRLYDFENKLNPDFSMHLMVEAVVGKGKHRLELSVGQVFTSHSRFETPDFEKKRKINSILLWGWGIGMFLMVDGNVG